MNFVTIALIDSKEEALEFCKEKSISFDFIKLSIFCPTL